MGFDPVSLAIEGGVALAKGLIGSHAASSAANTQADAAKTASAGLNDYAAGGNAAYRQQLAKYGITLPAGAPPTAPPAAAPPVVGQAGHRFGGTMAPTAATPVPQGYTLADILGQQTTDPTARPMNASSFGGR